MKRIAAAALALLAACASPRETRPLRELAIVDGTQRLDFDGFGVVVGLPGTGDSSVFASLHVEHIPPELVIPRISRREIAFVLVRARDSDETASVQACGDASSIEGGTLLPMRITAEDQTAVVSGTVLSDSVPFQWRRASGPKDRVRLLVHDLEHVPILERELAGARRMNSFTLEVPWRGGLKELLDRQIPVPPPRSNTVLLWYQTGSIVWTDDVYVEPGRLSCIDLQLQLEDRTPLAEVLQQVRHWSGSRRIHLVETLFQAGLLKARVLVR